MGKKTDKKVKSDRVNVLRKQYDAFLEEDKKRKDRNDYILGRLDKMRISSTAVQLRHTPNTHRDYYASPYNHARPENVDRNDMQISVHRNQTVMTRPSYHDLQLDVPRHFIEETSIFNEIRKKYILIPKLRTTYSNDGPEVSPEVIPSLGPASDSSVKPTNIDNSDWKSKYDILEQLKNKDKDEDKFTNKNDHFNNRESILKNNVVNESDSDLLQNYAKDELPRTYEKEIPEKDISEQVVIENELETYKISENNEQLPATEITHAPSALSLNPENAALYTPEANENMEQYTQPEQYIIPAEQTVEAESYIDNNKYPENYPEQELQSQQEDEYPIEYEQFIPNTEADANQPEPEKVFNQEQNDYSPIEGIRPNELVDEINKDISQDTFTVQANETQIKYSAEMENTQESAPGEEVVLQEGINPENYMTDDGTIVQGNPVPQALNEDPTDNSGIEEFDAEQRNMFYSEQADENYAYDEQGGDTYNAGYGQNQNFPPTEEYAYYEGAEQEQGTYPAEINEHEETQQLYDQHYEQQYAANYEPGFEEQAVYMEQDPNQPQFEQPALYDQAQKELDQYTYDQIPAETQEQVEQVLDGEDGYIEKREKKSTAQEHMQNAELNTP